MIYISDLNAVGTKPRQGAARVWFFPLCLTAWLWIFCRLAQTCSLSYEDSCDYRYCPYLCRPLLNIWGFVCECVYEYSCIHICVHMHAVTEANLGMNVNLLMHMCMNLCVCACWGCVCFLSYSCVSINTYACTRMCMFMCMWYPNNRSGTSCFSDRASWIDYILITNLMHWLLFIHKILFSSTCFEPQVLIFRRIQLYSCSMWYFHSL